MGRDGVVIFSLPGGEDYQYQAATAEVYKDEAQMFCHPSSLISWSCPIPIGTSAEK